MRILIVAEDFPPAAFGGMAQHAWHIAQHLSRQHQVRVLVPRKHRADWGDVPFAIDPCLSMRFPALDVVSILRAARAFKPDVVHVCNAALSYRPVSKRYPMVARTVGNDFLRAWCGYRLPLRSLLHRLPSETMRSRLGDLEVRTRRSKAIARLQAVDAVVANSGWTRDQLVSEGVPEELVCTIVGGVDTATFAPPPFRHRVRSDLGLPADCLLILTAANLVMKKNIDIVLRVVANLAPGWPSLRYIIVGDGPCEAHLRRLAAALGVSERVVFAGRKSQAELCRYYQAADVYVQASRDHRSENGYLDVETMGRTYMEAGACGIPVVAARVGGVPSVVVDGVNGLLVENPLDGGDVATAVDRLLADGGLRQRMGMAGLEMARERFSWEKVAAAFEEAMVAVVDRSRRGEVRPIGVRGRGSL